MKKLRTAAISLIAMVIAAVWIMYLASFHYSIAGVPVLNYHMVNDQYWSALVMRTEDFEKQMKYLHDNGYHTITPDELYAYINDGAALPDKPILITFDDGYADNYTNAYPIMKKYGFTGAIFLITDTAIHTENHRYLSWAQVEEMAKNNFSFESHTVHHKRLTDLSQENLKNELVGARAALKEHTGRDCIMIAYPEGEYNETVLRAVKDAGYRIGFTVDTGRVERGNDPLLLPRIPVFEGEDPIEHMKFRLCFTPVTKWLWNVRNYLRDKWHVGWIKNMPLP